MKINIEENKVTKLSLEKGFSEELAPEKKDAEFTIDIEFSEDHFSVTFDLNLKTADGVNLELIFKSKFTTDEEIDEEFRKSSFPYVNAPAIAYPYLRAYISTITLNSGYMPVMLPSINFAEMYKRSTEKNEG